MDMQQTIFEYGKLQLNYVSVSQQLSIVSTALAAANKEIAELKKSVEDKEHENIRQPLHCTHCGKETEAFSRHVLHNECYAERMDASHGKSIHVVEATEPPPHPEDTIPDRYAGVKGEPVSFSPAGA